MIALLRSRRGTTSLEMALVMPTFMLFIFGMLAAYSLINTRRALDYGIEKALRYAAVHSGGGTSGTTAVANTFSTYAGVISQAVGTGASVSVTSTSGATFSVGDTVTVAVSYAWSAPGSVVSNSGGSMFPAVTLTASASVRAMN